MDSGHGLMRLLDFSQHPLVLLLILALLFCTITRLVTASSRWTKIPAAPAKLPVPTIAYWLPFAGYGPQLNFSRIFGRRQKFLLDIASSVDRGIFALKVFGRRCVVVTDPALRKQVLLASSIAGRRGVTRGPSLAQKFHRVFGASTSTARQLAELDDANICTVHDLVEDEDFATATAVDLAKLLDHAASTLTSKSASWVDQAAWERFANAELPSNDDFKSSSFKVSAHLHTLVMHFTVPLLVSSVFGLTFADINPDFTVLFLRFAVQYERFSTGLPYWMFPGGGPAALGRETCLRALETFANELLKATNVKKEEVEQEWGGIEKEVHPKLSRSIQKLHDAGVGSGAIACWLLSIVFDIAWTTSNLVFWTLLAANEGTRLDPLRDELTESGAIHVVRDQSTGTMFKAPTRVKIAVNKLLDAKRVYALHSLVGEIYDAAYFVDVHYVVEEKLMLHSSGSGAKDKDNSYTLLAADELLLAGASGGPSKLSTAHQRDDRVDNVTPQTIGYLVIVLSAAILSMYRLTPLDQSARHTPTFDRVIDRVAIPRTVGKHEIMQS